MVERSNTDLGALKGYDLFYKTIVKVPVKIIHLVKIAHSLLQSMSNLSDFMISSLLMWFYIWLSKNFSKRRNRPFLSQASFSINLPKQLQCTAKFVSKTLKDLFFVSIVFIAPCITLSSKG